MNPNDFVAVMRPILGAIVTGYIIIAIQFAWEGWKHGASDQAARALFALVAIFVLCACNGYLGRIWHPAQLVSECLAGGEPRAAIVMHLALAIAVAFFIATNQAGVVIRRLTAATA